MPKQREDHCPECAEVAMEPYKSWELVAPFSEKKIWITLTMFSMFKCSSCDRSFRGVVS